MHFCCLSFFLNCCARTTTIFSGSTVALVVRQFVPSTACLTILAILFIEEAVLLDTSLLCIVCLPNSSQRRQIELPDANNWLEKRKKDRIEKDTKQNAVTICTNNSSNGSCSEFHPRKHVMLKEQGNFEAASTAQQFNCFSLASVL